MKTTAASPVAFDQAAFDRKARRFARLCLLLWCGFCLAIYWLSGFEFVRSPALGWLVAITLTGLPVVLVLAAGLVSVAKTQAISNSRP